MDRATALSLWKDVLANSVKAEGPDLSARQAAILMRIYLEPGPHTVRGLAGALNLGKPAVSRALDALTALDFVRRRKDEQDLRNVLVQRTTQGADYLCEFGDRICQCELKMGELKMGELKMGEPAIGGFPLHQQAESARSAA